MIPIKIIKVNNYWLDKIADRMAKKFGIITKEDESGFILELFSMEANLIKVLRKYPEYKSGQIIEAIDIFLLKIEAYLNDELEYLFPAQLIKDNQRFLEALQKNFDPFSNQVKNILNKNYNLKNKYQLQKIFSRPVKCVLRIRKKAVNGYFNSAENSNSYKSGEARRNYFVKIPL